MKFRSFIIFFLTEIEKQIPNQVCTPAWLGAAKLYDRNEILAATHGHQGYFFTVTHCKDRDSFFVTILWSIIIIRPFCCLF